MTEREYIAHTLGLKLKGENATYVWHNAHFGLMKAEAYKLEVSNVAPFDGYDKTVWISTQRKKGRKWGPNIVRPINIHFATIERDGQIIYDSRWDVPCDMNVWEGERKKHEHNWSPWLREAKP